MNDWRDPVRLACRLFYVNTGIWLTLAAVTLTRPLNLDASPPEVRWIIALLMLGNAVATFVAGFGVGRNSRLFWYVGMGVLIVNLVLTVTDQVGLLDLVVLIVDLILLAAMIQAGRRILSRP